MPTTTTFPPAPPKTEQPWTPTEVAGGYVKDDDLAPYAKTSEVMPSAASISGYDKTKVQALQHDATGALKWVDVQE